MHGCRGACMVVGGMHGGGEGVCVGYDEIRSMSGRYASYWNAFWLFETSCRKEQNFAFSGFFCGKAFLAVMVKKVVSI